MIKVLKKRNKVKCKICKSRLEFESEDVEENVIQYKNLPWDDRFYYITCPICKAKIELGNVATH